MCAALRSLPFQLLVYVGCCDATAVNDLRDLLSGDDGFAVADAARFDHFPKTAFTGSALLLLRGAPTLFGSSDCGRGHRGRHLGQPVAPRAFQQLALRWLVTSRRLKPHSVAPT